MHRSVFTLCVLGLALSASCVATSATRKATVVDYLYPKGTPAQPPTDVVLELPVRVGIAFAPGDANRFGDEVFDEKLKRDLLDKVAQAFLGEAGVQTVEIIPTSDLQPEGGFENLDQIAAMHGIKMVALLSYEQVQFGELSTSSWTYWTVLGAYVVEGNRNETRTLIDASVFDIRSRALLFRSSGSSAMHESSTAIKSEKAMRGESREGFGRATDDLIVNLHASLDAFREQAKSGTVHGLGTPAISTVAAGGGDASAGGSGAGALGMVELALLGLMLAACARSAFAPGGGGGARGDA
jgi:rhombotail lipoprotein